MAEPVRNYPKLAADILQEVGGSTNVTQASRCATRLRLVLHETPGEARARISNLPGVITVVESGGQFQVVIGPHVGEVYDEFVKVGNISESDLVDAPKQSVLNRVIATMSGVFAPFVYILAAAGILQGALILGKMAWPAFANTGTFAVLSFMSWTPFTFLPIFIAITASKHFRSNTLIAVLCCAAIMNPTWGTIAASIATGTHVRFLGIPLSRTVYTSSVLPPLFLVWVLSYLEHFLTKHLRGTAKQLLTPLLCLLVMVPLTLLVIGPVTAAAATGLADGYNWLVRVAPPLAGALIGGLFQTMVIFGVHWATTPMVLANFQNNGHDSFQAFQTAAVLGQVGAAFGVFLRTRNKELKGVAGSAAATGFFGITEPVIYGVTLRLKKPFILGSIAGAVGGIFIALFHGQYFSYAGLPGPLTIINAQKSGTNSLLIEVIGALIAFVLAVALVVVLGFKDPASVADTEIEPASDADASVPVLAAGTGSAVVADPLSGRVIALSAVPDPVFASGAMGGGAAIEPSDTRVYAPFDGTVVALMPHAVGLKSDDGVELLIHVGLDTVQLKGQGFTAHVQAKQQVHAGDLLMEFDRDAIAAAGYPVTTVLAVTNAKKFADIVSEPGQVVEHGDPVLTAVRAEPTTAPIGADAASGATAITTAVPTTQKG